MDFELSSELRALQARVREFVAEQVIPLELDPRQGAHGPHETLRQELVERARRAGLLTPHASTHMVKTISPIVVGVMSPKPTVVRMVSTK